PVTTWMSLHASLKQGRALSASNEDSVSARTVRFWAARVAHGPGTVLSPETWCREQHSCAGPRGRRGVRRAVRHREPESSGVDGDRDELFVIQDARHAYARSARERGDADRSRR